MLERICYPDRETWLAGRMNSIGGSEAAAVIGKSTFMSNVELWRLKTGIEKPKDLSQNSHVQYGNRLEGPLRNLFAAEHPEMKVEHHAFDVLYQTERPWLTATLDGELTEEIKNAYGWQILKGVLEIKTADVSMAVQYAKWRNAVPMQYYCQCIHQLIATGYDFVCLYAQLRQANGDSQIKCYRFNRNDGKVIADMDWLLSKEEPFWNVNVIGNKRPNMILN